MEDHPRTSPERAAEYLREAVRMAAESAASGGGPFAALVVKDGTVIARGTNSVTRRGDPTAHAEIEAIRAACAQLGSFRLEGCEVFASTEPCPMCLGALYWARPAAVWYASGQADAARAGFDDRFIYDELGRAPEARGLPTRQIRISGAGEEFRVWAANPDRTAY